MSPTAQSLVPALADIHLPVALEDSWQRSFAYGLARDDEAPPWVAAAQLQEAQAQNELSDLIPPLLTNLSSLAGKPAIMVLADATGLVLETWGKGGFLHKAQRYALAPGNQWAEQARGTNAIGTALAALRPCEVSGGEHFLNRNAGLFCSASPVFRPDGRLAGVLDLSAPARTPLPNAAAMIRQAVNQLEHTLTTRAAGENRWLLSLHRDARWLGSAGELLLIFEDNTLLGANKLAMDAFGLSAGHFGATPLAALFPGTALRGKETELTFGDCRYYVRQHLPERRISGRGMPRPAQKPVPEQEKALRIINAGIALCITGETGSGKEYLARQLHKRSQWRSGNFVAINCAALPEHLIESELFGYVPGAFTGASPKGYIGKCREADGGVLFLDEIGDMPLALQTRLLRVLQEKRVTPLGANSTCRVNFALICATHHDLAARVAQGAFREDLFYRIQEFQLRIPPLREWQHIDSLIHTLWQEQGALSRGLTLSPEVVCELARRRWPGNVRQLLSLLRVLIALADDGEQITLAHLPADNSATAAPEPLADEQHAIAQAQGNMSLAAKKLGIARSTLYRRLVKRQTAG